MQRILTYIPGYSRMLPRMLDRCDFVSDDGVHWVGPGRGATLNSEISYQCPLSEKVTQICLTTDHILEYDLFR
jgi:hypothetical protein